MSSEPLLKKTGSGQSRRTRGTTIIAGLEELQRRIRRGDIESAGTYIEVFKRIYGHKRSSQSVPQRIRSIASSLTREQVNQFMAINPSEQVSQRGGFILPIEGRLAQVETGSRDELLRGYLLAIAESIDIQPEDVLLHARATNEFYSILQHAIQRSAQLRDETMNDFAGLGSESGSGTQIGSEESDEPEETEETEAIEDIPGVITTGPGSSIPNPPGPGHWIWDGEKWTEKVSPDEPGGPKRRTAARDLTDEFEEEAKEDQGLTGQELDLQERQEGLLMTPVPAPSEEEKSEGLVNESEVVEPQSSAIGAAPSDLVSEEISDSQIETEPTERFVTPPAPGPSAPAGTNVTQTDIANLGDFADFDLDFTSDDSVARSQPSSGSGSYSEVQPMPTDGSLVASSTGQTARSTGMGSGVHYLPFKGTGALGAVLGTGEAGPALSETTLSDTGETEDSDEPSMMSSEFTETDQAPISGANAPATRRAPGTRKIYDPIHADALGLFFYDAFNPQWDLELFKDRLRRFGSIKNLPPGPFYKQSKMIVDKFGADILIESLKFGPTSALKDVFKENHEVLQLYFSLKNPHTGTRSSKPAAGSQGAATQTVGVPLGELAAFRGLIAGQRPTQAGFNVQGQPAPATTSPAASTPDAEGDLRVKIPEPEWVTKLRGSGVRQEQRQIFKSNPVYYNSQFIDSIRRARTNVDDTESPYSLSRATEMDQTVQAPTDRAGSLRMASPDEFCSELYGINF